MTGYFRLFFDIEMPDAWYLECVKDSTGREILPVVFRHGHRFEAVSDVHPYVEVLIAGQPADFRYTVGGVPISSKRFGEIVQRIAPTDIQRIPVAVRLRNGSEYSSEGYEILNVLAVLECLDIAHSKVSRYPQTHWDREKVGNIAAVTRLKILPERAAGHHIFRLAEWPTIIVISEKLRDAFCEAGLTGLLITEA